MITSVSAQRFRPLAVLLLVLFLAYASVGVLMTMHMDMSGAMTDCALMHTEMSLCPMSIVEHIATWQLSLFALPIAVVLFVVALVLVRHQLLVDSAVHRRRFSFHARDHSPGIALFAYLPQLFARGILHSRLYA